MFETQGATRNRTRDLPKKGFITSSDHWTIKMCIDQSKVDHVTANLDATTAEKGMLTCSPALGCYNLRSRSTAVHAGLDDAQDVRRVLESRPVLGALIQ